MRQPERETEIMEQFGLAYDWAYTSTSWLSGAREFSIRNSGKDRFKIGIGKFYKKLTERKDSEGKIVKIENSFMDKTIDELVYLINDSKDSAEKARMLNVLIYKRLLRYYTIFK